MIGASNMKDYISPFLRAPTNVQKKKKKLTVVPRMTKLFGSPCSFWKLSISLRGKAEQTSAFRTKKPSGLPETI